MKQKEIELMKFEEELKARAKDLDMKEERLREFENRLKLMERSITRESLTSFEVNKENLHQNLKPPTYQPLSF